MREVAVLALTGENEHAAVLALPADDECELGARAEAWNSRAYLQRDLNSLV